MKAERPARGAIGVNQTLAVGVAAALSAVILVAVFLATIASPPRGAALAAAAAFLLLVAIGIYLYSWPLGAPGRSE